MKALTKYHIYMLLPGRRIALRDLAKKAKTSVREVRRLLKLGDHIKFMDSFGPPPKTLKESQDWYGDGEGYA